MAISLARGRRTTLAKVDAFADGVAVKTVGRETFRLCRELVDGEAPAPRAPRPRPRPAPRAAGWPPHAP